MSISLTRENDLRTRLGATLINLTPEEHRERVAAVFKLGLPSAAELSDCYAGAHFTIVGSGPSAADTVARIPKSSIIIACNGAHDWLVARGIIPHFGLLLDPNPWVAGYQEPRKDVKYIVGTTCHPAVWRKFLNAGVAPFVTVPMLGDTDHTDFCELFPNEPLHFLAGQTTTGLRAFNISAGFGGVIADGHGLDSCYAPGAVIGGDSEPKLYAHYKPRTHHDARVLTMRTADWQTFRCRSNGAMARQLLGFDSLVRDLSRMGVNADVNRVSASARESKMRVRIFGDGAIPWRLWKAPSTWAIHAEPDVMRAKYGDARHWDYHEDAEYPNPFPQEELAISAALAGFNHEGATIQ